MGRALTVTDILKVKHEGLKFSGAWADAFGEPERRGVWFIWGQSGSGKTSFTMQLCWRDSVRWLTPHWRKVTV